MKKTDLKKLSMAIIIVLPFLVLTLVKTLTTGHFRNDALKWAGPSINKTNLVSRVQLQGMLQPVLLVNLGAKGDSFMHASGALDIDPENLVTRENQTKLRAHKGSIVLISDDPALSARIWMLLSQMGYRNLYLLSYSKDNEVFKYKFRPDTSIGPELQ
jgi:hypothetical protein